MTPHSPGRSLAGVSWALSRLVRASLLDEFSMEYVRVSRAMGLRERTVVNTHAMRNALLPTITIVAFTFAFLLTGAVLTETVFSWPGVGSYAVEASRNLDFPAIIGVTILGAWHSVTNLITDVAYALADPRIRFHDCAFRFARPDRRSDHRGCDRH